jgi:predicted ATPase with chaperone activity
VPVPQTFAVPMVFEPREIHSVGETGLNSQFLGDLALKIIYYASTITGHDVALRMRLPFQGVIDEILDTLKRESLVEVRGGNVLTSASYTYLVTSKGVDRASELIDRCAYAGPAPVSLGDYWVSVQAQSVTNVSVNQRDVHEAYGEMVISDKLMNQLGPAINSAQSIFLFGPPGNGKTSLAETASRLLGGAVYIPYAVEHDGQVIKVYDSTFHAALEMDDRRTMEAVDRRWVRSRRPVVVVGGELTMQALDLVYSAAGKFYEAPLQLKANCGMFLIDDFGRQQMAPRDLLNRWIVPLEKREDYLNMQTGQELTVPFDQLIIFSTNLEPASLVDEAFLRRIRYKIEVPNPTIEEFEEIFRRVCDSRAVPYDFGAVQFVLDYYDRRGIEPRCCHPRDLVDQMIDIAKYMELPRAFTRELLESAADSYFVRL